MVLRDTPAKIRPICINYIRIFSKTKENHLRDIGENLSKLYANFLKLKEEYKNFPEKGSDIVNHNVPKILRSLSSFLRLLDYYRHKKLRTKTIRRYLRKRRYQG